MLELTYDSWWKKELGNIKPYKIEKQPQNIIDQLRLQVQMSTPRIFRTREFEVAETVCQNLNANIDKLENDQCFNFSWALRHYRYPPVLAVQQNELTP
jgi:hypothetical protein